MLHAGLDLSRRKLDICLLSDQGEHLDQLVVPPDVDSLRTFARRVEEVHAQPVMAVIESMTGASGEGVVGSAPLSLSSAFPPSSDVMRGKSGNDRLIARDFVSDWTIDCDGDGASAPGNADKAVLDLLPDDPNYAVTTCDKQERR